MRAVILAAGKGTRLRPLTESVPKCFTEVCGTPILMNALEHLHECSVRDVTLVVGYLAGYIREHLGSRFMDIEIMYAENERYEETSTSFSLLRGIEAAAAGGGLLVLEGDVFFERLLLGEFLAHPAANATVVERWRPGLDGSFVTVEDGRVTDWIHASQREEGFTFEDKRKTVNIHKFDEAFVRETLLPVLRAHVGAASGQEPLEYVMRDIVRNHGTPVHAFETGMLKWFEIDDREDLWAAEEIFAKR